MKKLFAILLASFLLVSLVACGSDTPDESTASVAESSTAESGASSSSDSSEASGSTTRTDVLYADFTMGTDNEDLIKEYPFEYTGEKKNAAQLSDELSSLTGLNFTVAVTEAEDGLIIDWSNDSTLLAGLGDIEQKEEFRFYDNYTLQWFMMDSLWRTLKDNLDVENIYYTMEGGKDLSLEDNLPVKDFPADVPYMGSIFYFAHADNNESDFDFSATKGIWLLDGRTDTASIEMDGEGNFTLYYADGAVEATGTLNAVDEYDDGEYRYDLVGEDGNVIISFYFDTETQIHTGNGDTTTIYLLAP